MLNALRLARIRKRVVPGQSTVTLHARDRSNDNTATFTQYTIAEAQRRPLTSDEMMASGITVSGHQSAIFLLWQEILTAAGAPTPREGDKITDADGNTWHVQRNAVHLLGQAHHLTCERA